jgi:hypothetical protein
MGIMNLGEKTIRSDRAVKQRGCRSFNTLLYQLPWLYVIERENDRMIRNDKVGRLSEISVIKVNVNLSLCLSTTQ